MSERRQSAKLYDFVHPGHRLVGEWPVLEQLHERLVADLADRLRERFRMSLGARAEPTRRIRYDTLVAELDASTLVNEITLGREPGVLLFCLERACVPALVDGWFGGTPIHRGGSADQAAADPADESPASADGDASGEKGDDGDEASDSPKSPPLPISSATERRALRHVLDAVVDALARNWVDIADLGPGVGTATTPERLARGGYGEIVIDCMLHLTLGDETMNARLIYPAALLEPFAARLSREDHTHPVEDQRFRQAIGAGLMDCELEVRGVLAETRITLRELMAMKPGDFIPLKDMQNVSFRTENTPLFDARVGNTNGRVSASLSRWHLPRRP